MCSEWSSFLYQYVEGCVGYPFRFGRILIKHGDAIFAIARQCCRIMELGRGGGVEGGLTC